MSTDQKPSLILQERYDLMTDGGKKPKPHPTPHPVWGTLVLTIILSWLTFTLWLNAADFDSTEGKSIGMVAGPLLAGWGWWFYRYQQTK